MSVAGAPLLVPALMTGELGCTWKLPVAALMNCGSALMLPVPAAPPSTSLYKMDIVPEPTASPPVSPHRMELVIVTAPVPGRVATAAPELLANVTFVSIGSPFWLANPPPPADGTLVAVSPLKIAFVNVGDPQVLNMPPPISAVSSVNINVDSVGASPSLTVRPPP